MSKKLGSPKKPTKSLRSPSTRRSNAFTPTSSSKAKQALHEKLATELLIQSLAPSSSLSVQEAIVEGVSMWPVLRPGFRIRYRKVNPDNLVPGEIIVVQSTSKRGEKILRVHRLVGRSGPLFLEAGDNTFSASLVTGDRILGKVESALDAKGRKVKFPLWALEESRFRYFLRGAHVFMFTHELKD
ncbi:MAG: S24/S26 family peptidase, partial [Bdellovibrionota bacterium]